MGLFPASYAVPLTYIYGFGDNTFLFLITVTFVILSEVWEGYYASTLFFFFFLRISLAIPSACKF